MVCERSCETFEMMFVLVGVDLYKRTIDSYFIFHLSSTSLFRVENMIHTFHDEENVQSTIEKNDSKGAIKSKETIPAPFITHHHHHHINNYISTPPASCHSNSTLSTSQSSSHSTHSSSSSSERMAAVAIAPTRNTFHRQTRSIVDIILSVEKSSNCNHLSLFIATNRAIIIATHYVDFV